MLTNLQPFLIVLTNTSALPIQAAAVQCMACDLQLACLGQEMAIAC